MRPTSVAVVLAIVLTIVLDPRAARAAGPIAPEAKVALDEGLALYEARSYEQALAAFRRGYAIDQHPDFLYAMAQAERLSGDCPAASEDYRRFLQSKPPDHEASLAQENMAKCDALASSSEPVLVPQPTQASPPASSLPAPAAPSPSPAPSVQPPREPDALAPERSFWTDPAAMTLASVALASASAGAVLLSLGEARARSAVDAQDVVAFSDDVATARDLRIAGGTLLGAGLLSAGLSAITFAAMWAAAPAPVRSARRAPAISTGLGPRAGFIALELEI